MAYEKQGIRINKFMSEIGHCSRREADSLIAQGRITINGKVPSIGAKVGKRDIVKVDGRQVSGNFEPDVFLAFNKPVGVVCTTDTKKEENNIIDYVNYPKRIFPIGRLDKASEGLIFLTSNGDIVNKILRDENSHEKEYVVTVNKHITEDFLKSMRNGVPMLGTITKNCKVEKVNTLIFNITLTQGLNRQIRRMCEHLGYEVVKLKRVRIMNIGLDIPVGQWRDLSEEELQTIQEMIAESSKTESPPKKKSSASGTKKPAQKGNRTSSTSSRFSPDKKSKTGSKRIGKSSVNKKSGNTGRNRRR